MRPGLDQTTGTSAPFLSDRVSFLPRPANSHFILCKIIARPMHIFGVLPCAKMGLSLFALTRGLVFLRPDRLLFLALNWKLIILRVLRESIRIALLDEAGVPLPRFALENCPHIFGDEIARTVRWENVNAIDVAPNQPIRLQFELTEADLFFVSFFQP